MAAAAMNAWICELWMRGYVSYGCVSYGYVRVDVVAMNAWKHGSMEAWKHGSMEAWKHGSMNAWIRELWMRGCCCYEY